MYDYDGDECMCVLQYIEEWEKGNWGEGRVSGNEKNEQQTPANMDLLWKNCGRCKTSSTKMGAF